MLLLLSFPLLKKLPFSRSLLSLDLISKSWMLSAFAKNFLKPFFFSGSTSQVWKSIIRFCASKCFTPLNNSSIEFWILIIFLDIGSSFCLKLASFNLSLVMYKSFSPCISWPNLLVASKYFFTSSLGVFL